MKNIERNKKMALQQQSLLNSQNDVIASLVPLAKQMGINISLPNDEAIVISRWQFSRKFNDTRSALKFLSEMGVTP